MFKKNSFVGDSKGKFYRQRRVPCSSVGSTSMQQMMGTPPMTPAARV